MSDRYDYIPNIGDKTELIDEEMYELVCKKVGYKVRDKINCVSDGVENHIENITREIKHEK